MRLLSALPRLVFVAGHDLHGTKGHAAWLPPSQAVGLRDGSNVEDQGYRRGSGPVHPEMRASASQC